MCVCLRARVRGEGGGDWDEKVNYGKFMGIMGLWCPSNHSLNNTNYQLECFHYQPHVQICHFFRFLNHSSLLSSAMAYEEKEKMGSERTNQASQGYH